MKRAQEPEPMPDDRAPDEDYCEECKRVHLGGCQPQEDQAMAHTPGPWTSNFAGLIEAKGWNQQTGYLATINIPHRACLDGKSQHETRLEAQANARLIAAAPELLAALKKLYPILWNDGPLVAAYKDIEPLIEAAITHAEGQ